MIHNIFDAIPLIQAIHVMAGVTFLGLVVATFFYLANSIKLQNHQLIQYVLVTSFFADGVIVPIILFQYFSGTVLVKAHELSFHTPWIIVAYLAFSVITILWLMTFLIRIYNFKLLKNNSFKFFKYKYFLYSIYFLMIIIFCLIIHDAVMHKTYLWS